MSYLVGYLARDYLPVLYHETRVQVIPLHSKRTTMALATTPQSTNNGGSAATPASATATQTATATDDSSGNTTNTGVSDHPPVLRLTLRAPARVRWEEGIVDNEGMGRKSSKRCCIFHKQRDFGESSSDSSEDEEDRKPSANDGKKKKLGRIPKSDKPPDFQRYHA